MTDDTSGERHEQLRAARYRRTMVAYVVAAAAIVLGAWAVRSLHDPAVTGVAAVAATVIYVGVAVWGFQRLRRVGDELDARDNLIAAAAATAVYFLLYPSWLLLSVGGMVPEPDPLVLFALTLATAVVTYVVRKLRH